MSFSDFEFESSLGFDFDDSYDNDDSLLDDFDDDFKDDGRCHIYEEEGQHLFDCVGSRVHVGFMIEGAEIVKGGFDVHTFSPQKRIFVFRLMEILYDFLLKKTTNCSLQSVNAT